MTNANRFDRVVIVDWSAASALSPARPSADAIWLGSAGLGSAQSRYFRGRQTAEAALGAEIAAARHGGYRLLIGCDFPFAYPSGFAARLTGHATAHAVWAFLAQRIEDGADNRNNRFAVAAAINRAMGASGGPFWGRPAVPEIADLPQRKQVDYAALALPERRDVENLVPSAQPVWKLYTTGAAGSQGLMGQPMLHRLNALPGVAVWPFDDIETAGTVLAEVYPSLLAQAVRADPGPIKDEVQVRLLARALWGMMGQQNGLQGLLRLPDHARWREEGWILGAGQAAALAEALTCR